MGEPTVSKDPAVLFFQSPDNHKTAAGTEGHRHHHVDPWPESKNILEIDTALFRNDGTWFQTSYQYSLAEHYGSHRIMVVIMTV